MTRSSMKMVVGSPISRAYVEQFNRAQRNKARRQTDHGVAAVLLDKYARLPEQKMKNNDFIIKMKLCRFS